MKTKMYIKRKFNLNYIKQKMPNILLDKSEGYCMKKKMEKILTATIPIKINLI